MADEQDGGTTPSREGIFTMDPQTVVWDLARTLVRGQSDLVEMRRAADHARSVANRAPKEARRVVEQYQRLETSWYSETLPMIAASFKLALEVYDTFGPGMTRVEDATESAIWNNKHDVWVTELGGKYPDGP
jgi:hypothetical protein